MRALHAEDPTDPASGWRKKLEFSHNDGKVTCTVYAKSVEGYDNDVAMWDAKWTDINMEEYVKYSKDWDTIMKAGGANYD